MVTLIYLFAAAGNDTGILLGRVLMVVAFQLFVLGLTFLSLAATGDGGDEPGPDDDGRGWDRPAPRQPPPEPHLSWPDFERQFAEHVNALRARDNVPSA